MAGKQSTVQQGIPGQGTDGSANLVREHYVTDEEVLGVIALCREYDLPQLRDLAKELLWLRREYIRVMGQVGRLKAQLPYQYNMPPVVQVATGETTDAETET